MIVGALVTGAGGLLLSSAFIASPPSAVQVLGVVLVVGGLAAIGVAGGWREAWDALKAFFP